MARQLRFYFDYVSHNAYLAWTQLDGLARRHALAIRLEPVLFGAMAFIALSNHIPILIAGLFEAVWVASRDVTDPAVVAAVADAVGLDGAGLVADAATGRTKGLLKARTDAALANDVFGVPSFLVDGTVFWGCDDLPTLESWLAGEDQLKDTDIEPWLAVRSGIERRRP